MNITQNIEHNKDNIEYLKNKKHYDIIYTVPKVDDIIYVPDYEINTSTEKSLINCKKIGGAARVSRVIKINDNSHYVYVYEYTCYFEMHWERELKDKQEYLAKKYGFNRAFLIL